MPRVGKTRSLSFRAGGEPLQEQLCKPGIDKLQMLLVFLGRFIALLFCVLLFPAHLVLSGLITLSDGGPALYRCRRIGRGGSLFELAKYRTLKTNACHLLSSGLRMVVKERDTRVTTLGRILRCGVDELPQLWNIVKGDMAWVGPRPDPDWMLPHYGLKTRERLDSLPGIAGLAQVLDSRFLSTSEAFALDLWYLRHRTISLDLWIILATPFYVIGWRYFGKRRLQKLRALPDFQTLCSTCDKEFTASKEILLAHTTSRSMLPPNTVIC